jgi:hypothetical protein
VRNKVGREIVDSHAALEFSEIDVKHPGGKIVTDDGGTLAGTPRIQVGDKVSGETVDPHAAKYTDVDEEHPGCKVVTDDRALATKPKVRTQDGIGPEAVEFASMGANRVVVG